MKKKLIVLLAIFILMFSLAGCGTTYQETVNENIKEDFYNGYFTVVAKWQSKERGTCRIVYANDTKVKYLVISDAWGRGITPLYNADGTLQIYEGE